MCMRLIRVLELYLRSISITVLVGNCLNSTGTCYPYEACQTPQVKTYNRHLSRLIREIKIVDSSSRFTRLINGFNRIRLIPKYSLFLLVDYSRALWLISKNVLCHRIFNHRRIFSNTREPDLERLFSESESAVNKYKIIHFSKDIHNIKTI